MTNLLTNRSFQVFFSGLAALAVLGTLIGTGHVDWATAGPLMTAVLGFLFGVPVSPAESSPVVPATTITTDAKTTGGT